MHVLSVDMLCVFGVLGLRSWGSGTRFRVEGVRCTLRVYYLGFRVQGLGSRV